MDGTPLSIQARRRWFDRHTQLLSQWDAGVPYGAAGDEQSITDEVISTNYFIGDLRIYMRNINNPESICLPGSYDFIACGHKTVNLKSLVGQEAIVCLRNEHLVVRVIRRSKKRGLFDLYNHYQGPKRIITLDVKPYWAAPVSSAMPYGTWDELMADGRVKVLRDLHWPEGPGQEAMASTR